jgi:hypothetical protein
MRPDMAKIQELTIRQLMPTQLTVGMVEVREKTKQLAALKPKELTDCMAAHPMPAVTGPAGKHYITDHHHLGRAAIEGGVGSGFFAVEADFSACGVDEFWREMDRNLWVHPLDEHGVRHHYAAIPVDLKKLVDDPYRSLAAFARYAGAYEKTSMPFAEFIWADFFRRMIPIEDVQANFHAAVETAAPIARSHMAAGLPGFKKR